MSAGSLILSIVACSALLFLCYKLLSVAVVARERRRKIPYMEILREAGVVLGPADLAFPVRYATQAHFNNLFSLTPWEADGAFVVTDTDFRFYGKRRSSEKIFQFECERNNCLLTYIEPRAWRDGGLSWFVVEAEDRSSHYFCTKNHIPNLTSEFGTTALYEKITERYSNL